MAIQGLRTTGNFVTDQRPKNWREGMLMKYPNGKMPLTGLTSQMKTRTTDDPEFNWWEKSAQTRMVELGADALIGATSLTVVSGALGFKEGDLLYIVQNDEVVRITADPTVDTSLTVQRGYQGTTATALDFDGVGVNPQMVCIGSAYEEGSDAPTGVNFDPVKKNNYTQIFRNSLEATRTALKTRLRTGDQAKEAKRECLELHGIDMERAFLFSNAWEGTLNGKPIRTTGGIKSFIPSDNVRDMAALYAAGITFEDLETEMELIFRYGSSEKLVLNGNQLLLTLQRVIRGAKGISWTLQSDTEFGMKVTRVVTPFGTLVFKTHPLFNQMGGGSTSGTVYYSVSAWGFVLDMEHLKYVYLTDSDTKYLPDQQGNGIDGMKSGYLTECGLEIGYAESFFLWKNFHTAADEA